MDSADICAQFIYFYTTTTGEDYDASVLQQNIVMITELRCEPWWFVMPLQIQGKQQAKIQLIKF